MAKQKTPTKREAVVVHVTVRRAVEDLEKTLELLNANGNADRATAALLVLAARVDALEDTLEAMLPGAGRGI